MKLKVCFFFCFRRAAVKTSIQKERGSFINKGELGFSSVVSKSASSCCYSSSCRCVVAARGLELAKKAESNLVSTLKSRRVNECFLRWWCCE